MASVRSLDNALELDWSAVSGITNDINPITKDNGTTIMPNNGRIIRNLIHGADTVMSHITHFYALAALDYVDASYLGAPAAPTYTQTDTTFIPATTVMLNNQMVITNYLESLVMRRKCHTMSAILSGRHPIQNAIVPGGVTTTPTATDITEFTDLLDTVRNFINTAYIPDVITVAINSAYSVHFTTGTAPGNMLSYGDFPIQSGTTTEALLFSRMCIQTDGTVVENGASEPTDFLGNIREYVGYSYYSYAPLSANPKHPLAGETSPDVSLVGSTNQQYSWLKAPRFGTSNLVCEVGPLSRVYATVVGDGGAATVSESTNGTVNVTPLNILGVIQPGGGNYSVASLVTQTLTAVNATCGVPAHASFLVSTLGRHAARALECKILADAMADAPGAPNAAWLTELQANSLTSPVYVYAKLPKKPKTGSGWAEAPRGALGHWISIDKKRIDAYQCVVPSTWNHSPRDDNGNAGAAEQVIEAAGPYVTGVSSDAAVLNALRLLHQYDFCIACAVHLVRPDGSTIAKAKQDLDGKITILPNDAEI